jgi:hypothetical protein
VDLLGATGAIRFLGKGNRDFSSDSVSGWRVYQDQERNRQPMRRTYHTLG